MAIYVRSLFIHDTLVKRQKPGFIVFLASAHGMKVLVLGISYFGKGFPVHKKMFIFAG